MSKIDPVMKSRPLYIHLDMSVSGDKYRWLGREYTLSHIQTPSDEHMHRLLEVVNQTRLYGQIGG